ncbi:MAG TPA: Uma2 family endonuclease [Bryobacteraceae bacterium]|jgi:Uma2 family endonuclease|nr:Uma2 family endonuclease [Bryobacteraceae bacterium]
MSASALMSVEEYLKLDVKPYCEYIDGVLYQKPMPTALHSLIQRMLIVFLATRTERFWALPELQVRISRGKFLIPDVAVVRPDTFEHPYPTKPVFLCIKITSPDDRPGQLLAKCEEYHQWGVPHCWVIDPERRIAWIYDKDAEWVKLNESGILVAGEIEIPLVDVFSQIPKQSGTADLH